MAAEAAPWRDPCRRKRKTTAARRLEDDLHNPSTSLLFYGIQSERRYFRAARGGFGAAAFFSAAADCSSILLSKLCDSVSGRAGYGGTRRSPVRYLDPVALDLLIAAEVRQTGANRAQLVQRQVPQSEGLPGASQRISRNERVLQRNQRQFKGKNQKNWKILRVP